MFELGVSGDNGVSLSWPGSLSDWEGEKNDVLDGENKADPIKVRPPEDGVSSISLQSTDKPRWDDDDEESTHVFSSGDKGDKGSGGETERDMVVKAVLMESNTFSS